MNFIRKSLLCTAPYIVWTLVLSIGYALFVFKLNLQMVDTIILIEDYYVNGLFLSIPLVILGIAGKKTKYLWQFLIISIIVIFASFRFSNCYVFTFVVIALCFSKILSRTEHESSIFENVHGIMLLLFPIYFLITGFGNDVFMQKITVYHGVIGTLITFMYFGLTRFEEYVKIRKSKANMPSKRILDTGTRILMITSVIALLFLLPIIQFKYEFVPFAIKEVDMTYDGEEIEEEEEEAQGEEGGASIYEMLDDGKENIFLTYLWKILEYIAFVAVYALLAYVLIRGIYKLVVNFRQVEVEKNDIIESTFTDDGDLAKRMRRKNKIGEFFDFSKEMMIRRKYKKELKKFHPKPWQTPSEMETMAELDIPELHRQYEEARYGMK